MTRTVPRDTRLAVAVVGCGQIADGHVSEIAKIDCARVVAVCDREPLMAEQLAVRYGVPAHYADFDEMLARERPDVVHIATPPESHVALAERALDAGCHIYVEKPVALTYADTERLLAAVARAGKKIAVGHNSQFDPPMLELRDRVAAGELGEPVHVDSWFGYDLGGPFGKVILGSPDHWVHRLPGKLFQNNINHMLNKVTEFVTDDRPEIRAIGYTLRERTFGDVRDDLLDELRVLIRGERVSATATFTSRVRPVAQFMRVYGTRNIAHVDLVSRTVTLEQGPTLPAAIGRVAAGFAHSWQYARSAWANARRFARADYHYFAGLNTLIRRFYAHILDGAPAPIPPRDILRIAWMMDEIFAQIAPERS
ncbi:MAG: gfo/Idh/MocA family oxidoreductase [Deltaproteobacteria bacterium]|nr:MAG: gfo/Idh/MocA family oxidoreductase [Deltaproteobacteria bacterium]